DEAKSSTTNRRDDPWLRRTIAQNPPDLFDGLAQGGVTYHCTMPCFAQQLVARYEALRVVRHVAQRFEHLALHVDDLALTPKETTEFVEFKAVKAKEHVWPR